MKKLDLLKNFLILGLLILSFASCSKKSSKKTDIKTNSPPKFASVTDGVISFNAEENQKDIGTVSASDADSVDNEITYSIPSSADKGGVDYEKFTIEADTGVLSFASNFSPDKEAAVGSGDSLQPAIAGADKNAADNDEYIVVVRATSGSGVRKLFVDQAVKVTVINVEEDPQLVVPSDLSFDEEIGLTLATAGDPTGITFSSIVDAGDTVTYSIAASSNHAGDESAFSISTTSGVLEKTAINYNYEVKSSYTFKVIVTEGSLTDEQEVTISINDVDEDLQLVVPSDLSFDEEIGSRLATAGASTGITFSSNMDSGTVTYSIVASPNHAGDESAFSISTTSGVLAKTAINYNYEVKSSYTFKVVVTVGNLTDEQEVTINIRDVDESLQLVVPSDLSFDEEVGSALATAGASTGITFSSIVDSGTVTYSIAASSNHAGDESAFRISTTSGILEKTALNYNHEVKSSYTFKVVVTEGNRTDEQEVTININDVNEIPDFGTPSTTTFSFSEDVGSLEGAEAAIANAVFTATDPEGSTLSYSLEEVSAHTGDHNQFAIDRNTGQISRKNQNYDYEAQSSYVFAVQAEDPQGLSSQVEVTINISNVVEVPPSLALTVIPGISGELEASWETDTNEGRPDISGYKIFWDTTSGGTANEHSISTATTTTYTITGLTNGTTYYVHIKAINADGEGAASANVSGTPAINSPPIIQVVSQEMRTGGVIRATVEVQDPNDGDTITLTATSGDTSLVTVPSNIPTQNVVSRSATFTFDITILEGASIGDSTTITLSAQDGNGNSSNDKLFDVEITTSLNFISQWTVSTDGETITLPLRSGFSYNFSVDWGDNSTSEIDAHDDTDKTHTYAVSGDYTVTITGVVEAWYFNAQGDRNKITSVTDLGDVGWKNLNSAFKGCENLVGFAGGNVSEVTDMGGMFYAASSVTPEISHWDVSSVTDMSYMFQDANRAAPDVSEWVVSSVEDMTFMFRGATAAEPDVRDWNVSNVTSMRGMFFDATMANPDVSQWVVSSVADMTYMFRGATSADPNVSNWDVSSVTSMQEMFFDATTANPNVSTWVVSSVTSMQSMFRGATSADPDVDEWVVSSVTNMEGMFFDATTANPDVSQWVVSSVEDMAYMFRGATSAEPDVSNWNVSNVTSMRGMFFDATMANPDVSQWVVSSVEDMAYMFRGATSADPNVSNWDVSSVTSMQEMFFDATTANPNVSTWVVSSVTSMQSMFRGATSADPDVEEWVVSSVTNMEGMFFDATTANPDVSKWDVSSVTSMKSMFRGATSADPDVDEWVVSSVTNMEGMFLNATAANPDVSQWDVSNVVNMADMFHSATNATPNMISWSFSNVTDMHYMLYGLTLDTAAYSNLLLRIRQTTAQSGVRFHGGSSKYDSSAITARNELINNLNWTITDGGQE